MFFKNEIFLVGENVNILVENSMNSIRVFSYEFANQLVVL